MKKFTFFLFLFFPLLCFAQNKAVKNQLSPRNAPLNKQAASRQEGPQKQQEPLLTLQENRNPVQKEVTRGTPVSAEVYEQPTSQRPVISEIKKPAVLQEKQLSLDRAQTEKEKKPAPAASTLPPARPGNYRVVYWTDFIDNQSPKEKDWAIKVLDVKNISLDGRGVQVAILDSGIKQHSQFDGASIEVLDITGKDDPFDFCGHGTAVAGIIVGKRANDFKGIAPGVNLKSYKIADESGTTNNNYIISALDSILEYNRQRPTNKISIINISYGLEQDNIELKNKLAEVYASGVAIISAVGNDGKEGLLYPAAYNFVFAAGSIDGDKKLSDFSNWGAGLDFLLPGSGLRTLGLNNDYVWVKGTSFSSAYLTGIAALATQAFKDKYGHLPSPQELYEILQKISTPVRAIAPIKQGYGIPDASKIVSYI